MGLGMYITFMNQTEEAVIFYSEVFNVKCEEISKYSQMGSHPNSEELNDLIMHAKLNIHDTVLMFADVEGVIDDYNAGNNITLVVSIEDEKTLTDQFNALAQDGKIIMPLDKTFWSAKYGMLVDKFGIGWQFSLV